MPKRDHLDKQGRHMPTLERMEKHPMLEVETAHKTGPKMARAWLHFTLPDGNGVSASLTDLQLRWLINELGSAWSRVYGEQK
jgi:hypothetical protein